jgi:hypothetical protein
MMKHANQEGSPEFRMAVSRFQTANEAICVLVSALTYQVSARTFNPQKCDYCGEEYALPGPFAWASHHCQVLTAAENILSECVQHLLRERAIARVEMERYRPNGEIVRMRSA